MTDATITHTLTGVPAGSETCGECCFVDVPLSCDLFHSWLTGVYEPGEHGQRIDFKRCPDCLAAEERFSPEPPTEPGWYWARVERSKEWEIVRVCKSVSGYLAAHRVCGSVYDLYYFDLWSGPIPMPGGGE